MDNIRILHVLGGLDIGGIENLLMNVYHSIDREKIQFDFIKHTTASQFFDGEIKNRGGKVYSCPRYKVYNHFVYVNWWKKFFKEHPEYKIIHGHVRSTAAIYLKIAKNYGLKTISHSHSTCNNRGVSAIIKAILQFPIRFIADYFFACSLAAGRWLFGEKITKQKKFFVIPNAIDTSKFVYNLEVRKETRRKLNLENNFVIGHVGRLELPKNHTFLLKIFAEIYKQNSSARLLLVGKGTLKQKLIQQAEQLHIKQAILFYDNQAVENCYQAMDVFVFPSLYEGLGMAVIEAQTAGLPCIITKHLPSEIDLQCGLITRVNLQDSPKYWAQQILAKANQLRKSHQDAAIAKGFDIAETTRWLTDFYLKESV